MERVIYTVAELEELGMFLDFSKKKEQLKNPLLKRLRYKKKPTKSKCKSHEPIELRSIALRSSKKVEKIFSKIWIKV